ncbi:N-acetylmuramoyl-L-alanine amidase [Alkalicoccobacillus plakortidis]|uniref:N-acetylmuramoyl-L-alanine amidase n=1 Tax=Alkalicoccobacillus plakortidis TaxID=444060 RepID=A0ABT0XE29_9BACI|nr:N-acetylmuramoyl-L-alanine amidase [Alkalicoccobacillus plakortidis]MCM2674109.1 N-acetylmuramoyl-L-alanine amidase [Alkalicoccobacillus plakortidis]
MNIKQDLIPTSASNRPGKKIGATYITVHETANTNRGANAEMHSRYIKGADARSRSVSWHFTVDDTEIIQHLPVNEMGWHAGSQGNRQSVGIELCVNSDGNYEKAKANAVWLVQRLMNQLNIPLSRVVSHKHWTGKNCPAQLLNQWSTFKALVGGSYYEAPQTGGTDVKGGTYTVKSGDTLTSIAKAHNTTVDALKKANPSINPDEIQVGQILNLSGAKPVESEPSKPVNAFIAAAQEFLNSRSYPTKGKFEKLVVDGLAGRLTMDALVRVYQYFAGVGIDGKFGPQSKAAANTLRRGSTHQWWVRLLQSALNVKGYKLAVDGVFGAGTEKAVRDFQATQRITSDGIAGANTWERLFK